MSVNESSNSSSAYHEQDNGLSDWWWPWGGNAIYRNTQDGTSTSSQSLVENGTLANVAFTRQQNSNQTQTTTNSSVVSYGDGSGSSSDSSSTTTTVVRNNAVGREINGLTILTSLSLYQSVVGQGWQDGSSYSSWSQSSDHSRWSNSTVTQVSGSSAAGKGQTVSSPWSANWGTTTYAGLASYSWGDPSGNTLAPPPPTWSWPVPRQVPPPPPPSSSDGHWTLFSLPPQPQSGPDLVDQVEGKLRRNQQYEAMGQTPPPLTAGASPAYGNGNQTAGQAFADALSLSTQMLSTSAGPLSLGFNLAMAGGSLYNGNVQDALTYGSQAYINALEFMALLNPCGAAAKALALYDLTVNGGALFDNGFTWKGFLLSAYDLGALFFACFTGDMLLRCEGGKKRADAIREGDLLWSRDEHDPDGPLMLKHVLHRFERMAKIWHVRVAGQVLRTTLEHPFWVENRQSWLPVGELCVGDVVRTEEGKLLPVEGIEDSGKWERVYNWEIEDYHTYFVSASD